MDQHGAQEGHQTQDEHRATVEHRPMDEPGTDADVEAGEIPQHSAAMDESTRLRELHADVRNQDDLERDITRQVSGPD